MNPKDIQWLDKDAFLTTVELTTEKDPKAKKILDNRSEDPSDYMYLIYASLKTLNILIKKLGGEASKLLTRKKNNVASQKLREEGNKVFLTKNNLQGLEESLELYTESIAYAIPNTQEMAKGFANRSAVLLRLERPMESLEDIERVLNSNYPKELIPKLYIRQGECFAMLARHSYIHAKFWLKQVPENDPDRRILKQDLKDYSIKDYKFTIDPEADLAVPIIQSPHDKFPCASDAIDLKYSGQTGRTVVATRDIYVGEVLIVEKPYLTQLFRSALYAYCYECQQSFLSGIPCDTCPNVAYCSEKCKLTAWKEYHNVECPVLNLLLQNETDDTYVAIPLDRMTASLKLAIKFSYEAGGLKALQKRVEKFQKCYDGKLKSEWYKKQTLESILTLNSNIKKISDETFQIHTAVAIYVLFHLATTTNFLGNQYDRSRLSDKDIVLSMAHNKNVQFVGGLLVKLSLILKYNHTISKELLRSMEVPNSPGIIVSSFLEIVSSKCYFNCTLQFIGKYVVLRSIAPIKTGEEVSRFIYPWMFVPKEERLSDDDWLTGVTECSCRACVENWPTQDYLESFKGRAKSSKSLAKLQKVLQPFQSITDEFLNGKTIKDSEKTIDILKQMMEVIYQEVNLPCTEQVQILTMFLKMYKVQTSKRSWRQDFSLKNFAQGIKIPEKYFSALQIST